MNRAFILLLVVAGSARAAESDWTLSGQTGWNSLAGTGLVLSRRVVPHFGLDAGLGLSTAGAKLGLRARGDLYDAPTTPFLSAGVLFMPGGHFGDVNRPYEYDVLPSPFVQAMAGVRFQGYQAVRLILAAGWSWELRRNNYLHFRDHGDKGDPFDFLET